MGPTSHSLLTAAPRAVGLLCGAREPGPGIPLVPPLSEDDTRDGWGACGCRTPGVTVPRDSGQQEVAGRAAAGAGGCLLPVTWATAVVLSGTQTVVPQRPGPGTGPGAAEHPGCQMERKQSGGHVSPGSEACLGTSATAGPLIHGWAGRAPSCVVALAGKRRL